MKMETPKMDVVRFEEADVIVASGVFNTNWKADVADCGGTKANMSVTVTKPNEKPTYTNFEELVEIEKINWLAGATFYNTANDYATLVQLIDDDKTTGEGQYSRFNGYYESSDNGASYWRVNQVNH